MEILKSTQGLKAADIYSMTKGSGILKMQYAKGEVLNVSKYVLYNDVNQKDEVQEVLAVETVQGVRYATNSKTFIRNFFDILSAFENMGEEFGMAFLVGSGTSKNGREYLCCDIGYSA